MIPSKSAAARAPSAASVANAFSADAAMEAAATATAAARSWHDRGLICSDFCGLGFWPKSRIRFRLVTLIVSPGQLA